MSHRGIRYGRVRRNYLVNTMRSSYNGLVNTQKIIQIERNNKKSLEQKAINSDKNLSQ